MGKNRNIAFTLAEVLITLGIIGIVAALTLSSVINNIKERQYKIAAKKAYSIASQALEKMRTDEGDDFSKYMLNEGSFKRVFMQYFSILKDCGPYYCVPGVYHSDIYKSLKGNPGSTALIDEGQFVTTDGMFWGIQNSQYYNIIYISVDVNGYKKKPNVYGRDLFMFWLVDKFYLKPMGSPDSNYPAPKYCNRTTESDMDRPVQGLGCMYYVIQGIDY